MSSARSLADLLYRRSKSEPKPTSPSAEEPPVVADEVYEPRTQPIPLVPGELLDLNMPAGQEQNFPFEPGAPLPARGPKNSLWSSVPLSAAVVDEDAEPALVRPKPARLSRPTPVAPASPVSATSPASPEAFPRSLPAWPEPSRALPVDQRQQKPGRQTPGQQDLRPRAPQLLQLPSSPEPDPEPDSARKDYTVSNIETILKEAMQIDGAIGVALVDYTSGMTLGQSGGNILNLDVAAAGNTEVVRAKLRTMEALGLRDGIEDILITLSSQYHIIRLINDDSGIGLFLYLALNKSKANLAMARHKLATLERQIEI
jgi:hypothetical protein